MDAFISLLLVGLFSTGSGLSSWSCDTGKWLSQPELDEDGIFTAVRGSECIVTSPGGKVLNLDRYLLSRVGHGTTVNEGPIDEIYEGLPGVRYDLSMRLENDGNPMVIRSDVHFATDQKERFIYASQSKDIEASGTAGYLQKITEKVLVVALPENRFQFSLASSIDVAKPWYAPSGTFKTQMEKAFIKNFNSERDERIPHWGEKL